MVIYKLVIMTLLQHVLEKNYTKVHYPVMTASLFFYTFIARKQSVVKNVIGQSSPMNACLHVISYVYI